MKIAINAKTIMKAALKKVSEEEYFDALCLFSQVDSYESMLNQVACHAMLDYLGYANELYRKLLARYVFTHNCVADLMEMGKGVTVLLDYFYNDLGRAYCERDPAKVSADADLLGYYSWDDDMSADDEFGEIQELFDSMRSNASHESKFAEVGTKAYEEAVRERVLDAMMTANANVFRRQGRELLEMESDDPMTLELQLMLCYYKEDWAAGVKFAQRISRCSDASWRGLSMAAEVLHNADGDKEATKLLLDRLSDMGEEVPDADMAMLVKISSRDLGYGETTLRLTDVLYSHYRDTGCSGLKLCARVYFNCNEIDDAREAVLTLLQAAPWDSAGRAMLNYINEGISMRFSDPILLNDIVGCFDMPEETALACSLRLLQQLQNGGKLRAEDLYKMEVQLKMCDLCIVTGKSDDFIKHSASLHAMIAASVPEEEAPFVTFLKECLLNVFPDVGLSKAFIAKLLDLGCADKVFVAYMDGLYALDLGKVSFRNDKRFCSAFAYCAALRKVDVRRVEKAYVSLRCKVDISGYSERSVAYAMLAIAYKTFPESRQSEFFIDEDAKLYQNYRALFD